MSDNQPQTPSPAPKANPPAAASPASNKLLVKTPWHCSEFHSGVDGLVVTPKGVVDSDGKLVTVSSDQANKLRDAAKSVRMQLNVVEAN